MDQNTLEQLEADAQEPDASPTDTVMRLADEMAELKEEYDALKSDLKTVTERYDEVRKGLLPEAMRAAGMVSDAGKGSFTTSDGNKIHLRSSTKAYVRKADKPTFNEWLRSEGLGDLIREEVHYQTLQAFVRERQGEGKDLPDIVQTHDETKAVLRRS